MIDAVEVEFADGLNVLTGETGAGKSVLVGAVGLLLGGRASGDLVRTGEDLATIEAVFERDGRDLLVKREISAQGRSRAFVDGELMTAAALKAQTSGLVELHGQHEHHALLDASSHLRVLDAFARLNPLLEPVAATFHAWQSSLDALEAARSLELNRGDRLDLVSYQLGELERAQLKPGEDEELTAVRQVLAGADRLRTLCETGYSALYEQDGSVLGNLAAVWRHLGELAAIDPAFGPYLEGRDAIKAQLEDLADFLRQYGSRIDASSARLQQVEDRLAQLDRLKRKYGPDLAGAIARRDALAREAAELQHAGERVADLTAAETAARAAYLAAAGRLSSARREAVPGFAERLEQHLADLAMQHTRFEVRFHDAGDDESRWSAVGTDDAEFFVSPNAGEDLRPLARIASGGELSRIMLAVKTLSAVGEASDAATSSLVFDEVDAGIGGRVADVVGGKLRALGGQRQVLCITHLPQIAAHADAHYHVAKAVEGERTVVRVERLGPAERIDEIGRMLAGVPVTSATRAAAAEMLSVRRRPSQGESESEPKPKGETPPRRATAGARPARRLS